MSKQLWDKKAQTFPRFQKDTEDTLEILDFFRAQNVAFKDKTLLDIGAGNGRFALQLAFETKHIYATDTVGHGKSSIEKSLSAWSIIIFEPVKA